MVALKHGRTLDRALKALCTQTVKLYGYLGSDEYGNDSYDETPTDALCHIDGRSKEVITPTGAKRAADGTVYLAEVYPWLTEQANMHVPDLADPSGYRWVELLSVDLLYDEDGPYAQVLTYGRSTK